MTTRVVELHSVAEQNKAVFSGGPRRASRADVREIFVPAMVAVCVVCACQSVPLEGSTPPPPICWDPGIRPTQSIDKVDLLFAIDNSRSMGDKQALLAQAVPELIDRLLHPHCIDASDPSNRKDLGPSDAQGKCALPSTPEFPAIYDLHVGIVSSSLGGGGAEQVGGVPVCPGTATEPVFKKYNSHNDDKGHLINRKRPIAANSTGIEDTVADAIAVDGSGGNFLAWLPKVDKNTGKPNPNVPAMAPDPTNAVAFKAGQDQLITDFQALVGGTQEYGCGLEAQMESWYRFLIQPDPYDSIQVDPDPNGGPPKAVLKGVDATLLKQRHDFLRPDSLVAVIMITDEEDSWSDPLAVGGRGWVTRATSFPGSPTNLMPRGTSACDAPIDPNYPLTSGPNDPNCTSCGFGGSMANGQPISSDPNCQLSCGPNCAGYYTSKEDNLNIRYVNDMKRRYGLDPQFPVSRYINGLKSPKIPDRNGEHPNGAGNYAGKANCTNPLFAAALPTDPTGDLCNLPLGPRTSDLVSLVVIGGLPWQLLYDDKTQDFKSQLTSADWQKIIGKDPDHFDLTGIDSHMIESFLPRVAKNASVIPYLQTPLTSDPTASDTSDPYNGREWDTTLSPLGLDLQYACTFELPTAKECTDPANTGGACDCVANAKNPGGVPLCAPGTNGNSLQIRGKAYPTIRKLRVAKALGYRAMVASVCPRESKNTASPNYGYRPAMRQIVHQLTKSLSDPCLPQALLVGAAGTVPCSVFETFAPGPQASACDPAQGLTQLDSATLDAFNQERCCQHPPGLPCPGRDAESIARVLGPVCKLQQLAQPTDFKGTCATPSAAAGWCYVTSPNADECDQKIAYSAKGAPAKAAGVVLRCGG